MTRTAMNRATALIDGTPIGQESHDGIHAYFQKEMVIHPEAIILVAGIGSHANYLGMELTCAGKDSDVPRATIFTRCGIGSARDCELTICIEPRPEILHVPELTADHAPIHATLRVNQLFALTRLFLAGMYIGSPDWLKVVDGLYPIRWSHGNDLAQDRDRFDPDRSNYEVTTLLQAAPVGSELFMRVQLARFELKQ